MMLCVVMCTLFSLLIYMFYKSYGQLMWSVTMFCLGFFLGSLHHFCCVTCPADIGREQKNKRSTATIVGIIDGIGTAGSGVGQLVLGHLIDLWGWETGYLRTLFFIQATSAVPLLFILKREIAEIRTLLNADNTD